MKRLLQRVRITLFAQIVVIFGIISAPASAQEIIFVSHGNADVGGFWQVVRSGAILAGQHTGADVDYRAPETFDLNAMQDILEQAIKEKPDGLVVSIPDGDKIGPLIKRAVEAGIPVISINSGSHLAKSLGVEMHIGQSEYDAGFEAGRALAKRGGRRALCINQEAGNRALDMRCEGFAKGFRKRVTVIKSLNDIDDIQSKITTKIAADKRIDTILTLGSNIGELAVDLVKESGRNIMVATFDLSAGFLEDIINGDAVFAIDQQQYMQGYLPVSLLSMHAIYGGLIPASDFIASGPVLVTADKAHEVIRLSSEGIR